MPCFNPGAFLQEAVASVLAQPQCLELLVADGGSTDGSLERLHQLASADARLRIVPGPDQGPADALNKAFTLARGTLIGWLNADDLYPAGALARAVDALSANPHWLMVYGEGEEFTTATGERQRYPTLQPHVGIEGARSHCFICQPTVVFRRTMGLLLGPFDLQWRTAFDFDYWLRAFAAFPDRIGYLPTLQGCTRLHASTITSRQRAQVALEATALLARHFGKAPPTRLHCYALELQLGIAKLPGDWPLQDHLAEVFAQAEPWLTRHHYQTLQHDWLLDPSRAPSQRDAEQAAAARNHAIRPTAQLLKIVQPHLRPGHPAPPAGPHLRLEAALAQASAHCPLLQQEQVLQQLIDSKANGNWTTPLPFGVNLIQPSHPDLDTAIWLETLRAELHREAVPLTPCEPTAEAGPYAINLIALHPSAHAQWLLNHGLEPHLDRLTIAAWPWMASGWPQAWQPLLALVDELWAPSTLVQEALNPQAIPPLWQLPRLPDQPIQTANHPDRPADFRQVVLFADLRESPHLLNTFAAVEVFRRACPPPPHPPQAAAETNPRLLILVDNASSSVGEWQWLQACCAYDPRIEIRDVDDLPMSARLRLIAGADVFLSLQRSYALPSLLAFAQAKGLQVIATAFGAALDLPDTPNLHRIPARSVPIGRGIAPDAEGLLWGEPDREAAMTALQGSISTSRYPQQHACNLHPSHCGEALKARLQQLWQARRRGNQFY